MNPSQDVDGLKISPKPADVGLEGIRGIAALFVALSHIFYQNLLAPDLHLSPILREIEAGHAGVLVFFVLSGFVISWTNTKAFSGDAARNYVWRRFVRIFPIYFLAMLLTMFVIQVSGMFETPRIIVGAFLCLQNFNGYFGPALDPPRVNNPLWSLNFEVLYYALFLLLWRYHPRNAWVLVPALAAGILGWFTPRVMPIFISSYGCGWVFWASGWWLSMQPQEDDDGRQGTWVACWILLVFANHHINGVERVLNVFHFYSNDSGMVNLADLGSLPAILLALAAVTRRRLPCRRWLVFCAWAVCLVPIGGMIGTGRLTSHASWVVGTGATILAGLAALWRSSGWLRAFAWFGGISYAFYVIHYPLLYLVRFAPFSGISGAGFVERMLLWVALTLGFSWLLEKRFQPWIKRMLGNGKPSRA